MSVTVLTHLNFAGQARPALEFYRSVFGGQVSIGTYGQGGVPRDSADSDHAAFDPVPADAPDADRVSFAMLMADNGFRIAAYDVFGADGPGLASAAVAKGQTRAAGLTHTEPFFVVLNADTTAELGPIWAGLTEGGTVIQALAPSDFSPAYGMVTDRYGVTWVLGAMA